VRLPRKVNGKRLPDATPVVERPRVNYFDVWQGSEMRALLLGPQGEPLHLRVAIASPSPPGIGSHCG
jgi:hypothetical protein